jgi:predicted PurR-regulated permease PerM
VITRFSVDDKVYIARRREVLIRMSLLLMMAVGCFLLLRPFLTLITWGGIIAVAIFPMYRMLANMFGGREKVASALCAVLLLLVIIVPSLLLAGTFLDGIRAISHRMQAGDIKIPPPPQAIEKLPGGTRVAELWRSSSADLSEVASRFQPQIREYTRAFFSASAGIGATTLQFVASILLAGFLLANAKRNSSVADRVFARIFDDQGAEFKDLVTSTIRSVTIGILGVALIQTLLATLGFWFVGLPGTGLWAAIFLLFSVMQVGPLVLIPAVLYVFSTQSTSHAVMFLVWCIFVGLLDNVLKPILLGRGSKVPTLVIFLGVVGGFMAMRIIGLFLGAIILSVGYRVFIAWLDVGVPSVAATQISATKAS